MMDISQERIPSIRPLNNYVLVEPIVRTDEVEYKTLKLYFDNRFDRAQYQPVVCRVMACCKHIIYDPVKIRKSTPVIDQITKQKRTDVSWEPRYPNTMPWKTKKKVKYDDICWINYYPIVRAEDEHDETVIVYSGKKKYYLIHYSEIYCVKRKDDVIMLNGWILVQPIKSEKILREESLKKLGIVFPTQPKEQSLDKYGIVKYIGEPIEEYEDEYFCGGDDDLVQVGDTVRFAMEYNRRLEQSPVFRWFSGDELIVTRRRNLLGICQMAKVMS